MRCEILCMYGYVEGDSTFSTLRSLYMCEIFVFCMYVCSVSDVSAVQLIKSKLEADERTHHSELSCDDRVISPMWMFSIL